MNRILFLIPPQKIKDVKQTGAVWLRISIGYLAAYLRKHGCRVNIIDCKAEGIEFNQLEGIVSEYKPDILGLSAFTEEILDVAKACTIIKKIDPKILTVIGGPHPSALPVKTLEEFKDIDITVYGEGEKTLLELVRRKNLSELREINGIAYRHKGKVVLNPPQPLLSDIDSLPSPAWDIFNLDLYRGRETFSHNEKTQKKYLELPILGVRGCPFQCNFCYKVFGDSLRFREPSLVLKEIEFNVENYQADRFFFVEGTFGVKEDWGLKLCEGIIEKGLSKKIVWDANVRVDISEKLLVKMKEAGCQKVYFGVESGDEEILKRSGKNITIDQVRKSIFKARRLGFKTGCFFIVGHPYETLKQAKKTVKLARELDPEIFNLGIMAPFPGTKIYDMALKGEGGYKLLSKDWSSFLKQEGGALELENISLAKLKKFQSRAYINYYLRVKKVVFMLRFFTLSKIMKIFRNLIKNI